MPYILCVYYSRTGNTEKLMREIAAELKCELVKLDDGVDRSGLTGWMRSGMQAMSRRLPPVKPLKTAFPLGVYDLVIIGTPVWAGRHHPQQRPALRGGLRADGFLCPFPPRLRRDHPAECGGGRLLAGRVPDQRPGRRKGEVRPC